MNKDKIYELRIEEDDDISGIDSISLVEDPAIEVEWIAFNKQKPQEFYIPDGEDEKYINMLMDKGQPEEEIITEGFGIYSIEIDGKEHFVSTNPNDDSDWNESDLLIRYKYILSPRISGQASVIPTTRSFCKDLIAKNYVWRVEDMDATQNDFGESAMVWRGGYNCRHNWAKIKYKKDTKIINKASVNKGKATGVDGFPSDMVPDLSVIGYEQPLTVTDKVIEAVQKGTAKKSTIKNLGLSTQKFEGIKMSIDFDDTLSTKRGQDMAKKLLSEGVDLYIVTRRQESQSGEVYNVADEIGIPHNKVFFTNGKLKWEKLKELGIMAHIDNNPDEINAIKENAPDIEAIKFGYDNILPPFVDEIPTGKTKSEEFIECIKCGHSWDMENGGDKPYMCNICGYNNIAQNFESYSDYPEAVKENAKKVIAWVETNGWGSCGTNVGKIRANQLANGRPISMDTIYRMYSYLSRHKVDLITSKSYDDGCGKLMYDSWGGEEALRWSERKINQVKAGAMSKQYFETTDEEKRIVTGPAMIPNLNIFRKDKKGNPYYVYFTEDTIKMIAEKYMKNKYIDNNDRNHDGKAVEDVYVIESWIKEDMEDKSNKYGFSNLPIGTWFVSMKIKNDEVWNMVKEGKLRGFSVSGFFEEIAEFAREEMFLKQLATLLKQIKD